jgi:hypothetical protein
MARDFLEQLKKITPISTQLILANTFSYFWQIKESKKWCITL